MGCSIPVTATPKVDEALFRSQPLDEIGHVPRRGPPFQLAVNLPIGVPVGGRRGDCDAPTLVADTWGRACAADAMVVVPRAVGRLDEPEEAPGWG
eukprot:scaffold3185_cov111-Isochrysis_galbana.AAC.5